MSEAYNYEHAMERYRDRLKELKKPADRRLYACRSASEMRSVIEALPDTPQKNELLNMSALLLRMVLLENDGGPLSPSKLNAF